MSDSWPPGPEQPAVPTSPTAEITWTVRRRWMPRLGRHSLWQRFWTRAKRTFRRAGEHADVADGCGDAIGEGILVALALILAAVILIFVIIPLLVAIVDVLILLVLALLALVARVVFRRPWLIEASDGAGRVLRWRVVGWRASGEKIDGIRYLLSTGQVPPDAEVFADPTLEDE